MTPKPDDLTERKPQDALTEVKRLEALLTGLQARLDAQEAAQGLFPGTTMMQTPEDEGIPTWIPGGGLEIALPFATTHAGGLDVDVANGYVRGPVGTIPEDLLVSTPTITLIDDATNYLYLKLHYDYQTIVSIPYGTSAVATNYRWEVMQGTGKDPVVINSTTQISIGGPTGTLAAFNEYIPVAKVITSGNVVTSIEQFLTSHHVPVYQGWTDWVT